MPRNYVPRGLRAPKGSLGALLVVDVPRELKAAVKRAADARGQSVSEFVRRTLEAATGGTP
jgi:predicted HicB family RNase H-like nuclease